MEDYKLFLAGFGFPDKYLESSSLSSLLVYKKGDTWRKKTGEKFTENIFKYSVNVTYELGFEPAVDKIINVLGANAELAEIVSACEYIELQVSVTTEDNFRVPHIHLTSKQMVFLGNLGASLEININ